MDEYKYTNFFCSTNCYPTFYKDTYRVEPMDTKLKAAIAELWQKVNDMMIDDRLTQAEALMVIAEVERKVARAK